jgi:hypothetical protein
MSLAVKLPNAAELVNGELVEYRPEHFVRASAVVHLCEVSTDDGCIVQVGPGLNEHYQSPYPVRLVLVALNLAGERSRERITYTPEG